LCLVKTLTGIIWNMKIFISYRRADSTYLIGRIRDRLITVFGDESVFRDLDDIPAGVDFSAVLEKETNECNVMLVVIGPLWVGITDSQGNKRLFDANDYTRIEVETGLKRLGQGGATVIPILVMNAAMSSPQELPESLGQLTFQNAISVRNDPDFNHDMERLIRDINVRRAKRSMSFLFSISWSDSDRRNDVSSLFDRLAVQSSHILRSSI